MVTITDTYESHFDHQYNILILLERHNVYNVMIDLDMI